MKIYFLASQHNLKAFGEYLPKKFNHVSIHGSNSYEEAVHEILRKAPIDPYDLVIMISVRQVAEDIAIRGSLSERLKESSSLSLKDTPIFFVYSKSDKEIDLSLKDYFNSDNVRALTYDGKMKMPDIEKVITDSLILYEKPQASKREDIKDAVQRTMSSGTNNNYLNKAVVLGFKVSDKMDILSKYLNKDSEEIISVSVDEKITYLQDIKNKIKANSEVIKSSVQIEGDVFLKQKEEPQAYIQIVGIEDSLSEEAIHDVLNKSSEDYQVMSVTRKAIEEAVADLKTDEDSIPVVLDLMTEQSKILTAMKKMESEYMTEIIDEISKVSESRFDNTKGLVQLQAKSLNNLEGNKDIQSIERLKVLRDNLVNGLEKSTEEVSKTLGTFRDVLEGFGNRYIQEINQIETDKVYLANKYGIKIQEVTTHSNEVLIGVQQTYVDTQGSFGELQNKLTEFTKGVAGLIIVDNVIINSQTKVIEELSTGNVRKIVNVGGTLESKSIVVVSKDGAGKTVIATGLANSYQNRGNKVLVFDLDDDTPSLHMYGKDENIGYKFTMSPDNLTFKFEEENLRMAFINNGSLTEEYFNLNLEELQKVLNNNVNDFDRVIYIVPENHPSLYPIQLICKSTVYVTDSDVSNLHHTTTLVETTLKVTPINTVIVNKCSQGIVEQVKSALPFQIHNIAVIPTLYYSKFDYCKFNNLLPSRESGGFESSMQAVMNSIE